MTIEAYGNEAYGVYKDGVGDLSIISSNITTGKADYKNSGTMGYNGFGVWLLYETGQNVITGTTVTTYGMSASAVNARDVSLNLTDNRIWTYGEMSYGVEKRGDGNLSIAGGSITTGEEQFINQFDAETYSGIGYSSSGVYIQGNGEHVIGSSNSDIKTEITTYGMNANSIFVHEGALDLRNTTIRTYGDYARGVLKRGDGDLSISGGSITTSGSASHGVYLNGSNASLANTKLTAGANNAHAIYTTGGSAENRTYLTLNNVTLKSGAGTGIVADNAYVDVTVKGAVTLSPGVSALLRASNDRLLVAKNGSNVVFSVDGTSNSGIIEAQDTSILDLRVINNGSFRGQLINGRNVTVESGSSWNVVKDTVINGNLAVGGSITLSADLTLGSGVSFEAGSLLTFNVSSLDVGQLIGAADLTGTTVSVTIESGLDLTSGLVLFSDLSSITGLDLDSINVTEGYSLETNGNELVLKGFAPVPEPSAYAVLFGLATLASVAARRRR